ncbi:MAG: transposase [Candidatus Eremiobacteraeota bacterium]|nr:transposase [Candidatus Eremiobacteraeota bacterium]
MWSRPGERRFCYYRGTHIRESVLGAVNPKTGAFEALIMPYVNKDIFQQFLDHFNEVLDGRIVLMVQDNASWHKSRGLNWGSIIPIYSSSN